MSSTSHLSFETQSELQVCPFCGCIYLYISTTWRGSMASRSHVLVLSWSLTNPPFGSGDCHLLLARCILFFQIQSKAIGATEKSHTDSQGFPFSDLMPRMVFGFWNFTGKWCSDYQVMNIYNPLRLRYQPLIKFKWLIYWHIS